MKRYELKIDLFVDADNEQAMWDKFNSAGQHDILNQLDGEGCYNAEVIASYELRHEGKSELN